MQTKKISVTRALAELKRLDKEFSTIIDNSPYIAIQVGEGDQAVGPNNIPVAECVKAIQSAWDQIAQIQKTRSSLKAAIVKSNATVTVTVGGREMTVAEAIELKSTISAQKAMLSNMKRAYSLAQTAQNDHNKKVEEKIDNLLRTMYGADRSKIDASNYDAVAKPQWAKAKASLIDPLKLADQIKAKEKYIEELATEVDYTLSEINARTDIEYEV